MRRIRRLRLVIGSNMIGYSIDKIKFSTDPGTYERAVGLYENKKVKNFTDDGFVGYSAIVQGTQSYEVYVHARSFDLGSCGCYLGQNNTLCKHMVAVAIYAVMNGKPLKEEDKKQEVEVLCSGKKGELSADELKTVKENITNAMRYIKPYNGPSRLWFTYQNSLSEGCARLSFIISELPVSLQIAKLLVNLLLRLDKKLCNTVDDSDGTVGDFMMGLVEVLKDYVKIDSICVKSFDALQGKDTCFEWGESLLSLIEE